MSASPIAVVGIGTHLFSDQGFGLSVIKALQREELPDTVEIIEGGMSGLNLIPWMDEREKVIFVSAISANSKPGTVHRLIPSELEALLPDDLVDIPESITTPGQGDEYSGDEQLHLADKLILVHAIQMAEYLGITPEVVIIGAEPASTDRGSGLSPVLEQKIPAVVAKVKQEISAS
jgi:hydrogenase maturation protease